MLSSSPFSFFDSDKCGNNEGSRSSMGDTECELSLFSDLFSAPCDQSDDATLSSDLTLHVKTKEDSGFASYLAENCRNSNVNVIRKSPNHLAERSRLSAFSVMSSGPCMSRNAVAARENRQKKKEYLKSLETTITTLKSENADLKEESVSLKKSLASLTSEVNYLKGVIANQSTLATILGTIKDIPGLNLTTSFEATEKNNNIVEPPSVRPLLKRKRCSENSAINMEKVEEKKRKVTRSQNKKENVKDGKSLTTSQEKRALHHPKKRLLEKFQLKRWSIT